VPDGRLKDRDFPVELFGAGSPSLQDSDQDTDAGDTQADREKLDRLKDGVPFRETIRTVREY
jgi:hypothetical protein